MKLVVKRFLEPDAQQNGTIAVRPAPFALLPDESPDETPGSADAPPDQGPGAGGSSGSGSGSGSGSSAVTRSSGHMSTYPRPG
jgi:hypothetical protein